MSDFVEICVDIHEADSGIFNSISARDIGVCIVKHLETGDILIRYRQKVVAIEIKRKNDYDNSLHSGRLHNQIARLCNFDVPILIIEGWNGEDEKTHLKQTWTLNRRICLYHTKDMSETVDLIEDIAKDMIAKKLNVIRRKVYIEPDLSAAMKVICSLPNVKRILGERILDKYGTVEKALADVDNWTEIDGIGVVKLTRIKNTLEDEVYGE